MGKHKNKLFFWTFPFMEFLKSSLPWLFGKRKRGTWGKRESELVFEEPPEKKPRVGQGNFSEPFLVMAARKSYTSVVSWLFPQMASSQQLRPDVVNVVDVDDDDGEEEVQVLEVIDGRRESESSPKNIKCDPLPTFKGFSRPPKRRKVPEESSKENVKAEVKLENKTKSKLSKMLKSREIYRRMLEQRMKSNHKLESLIKEYSKRSENINSRLKRKLAKLKVKAKEKGDEDLVNEISETNNELIKETSEKNKVILEELSKQGSELRSEKEAYGQEPEVVDLDNSDSEEVKVVGEDLQVLDDLANIELVEIEDSEKERVEIIDITDESDYETDEDEAYYDNRTFVRKECDIVYDPSEDDSLEEEDDDDVKILENFPEIVTIDVEEEEKDDTAGDEEVRSSRNEVLVTAHRISITGEDLETLEGLNWLNDNIVNFYFSMIEARSSSNQNLPKTYVFSTFFYPRLQEVGHQGVARWTRSTDIFSYDLLLMPIHLGMHWCLATVDLRHMTINYYDSMGGNNTECLAELDDYLHQEYLAKKGKSLDAEVFDRNLVKGIPRQLNGSDCGVFTCQYAEFLSRSASLDFSQGDMPRVRRRMAGEILGNAFAQLLHNSKKYL